MPDHTITRRGLWQIAGGAMAARAAAARPNILWILAEDISAQLGCYGEPLVRTPHIDRIAKEGARFTNAIMPSPVCSPSRSAMLTGIYATSIGAHNHRTFLKKPLPAPVRLLTDHLRDAGYFTVLCGGATKKASKGLGALGSGKTDLNFVADKPFDGYNWNQCPPGQPWFAQLSLSETHSGPGWEAAAKAPDRIDPDKVKLPPYYPDHPIARQDYATYLTAIQQMDKLVGQVLERLQAERQLDNTLIFFTGDNGSGLFRGKQFLYEGGIGVPLLARWPGHVQPGAVRHDLVSGLDLAPASLAAAGIARPSYMRGRDFLDPRAPEPEFLFSTRDRCDIAIERMRCVRGRRWKYIRNFLPAIPYMQRNPYKERDYPTWNLVKKLKAEGKLNPVQALFAADSKPVEELYDLQNDPHEIRNLASDPSRKDRLLAMRQRLDEWIERTGDQGAAMEDPVAIYRDYFETKGKK
jgi:N-sulfoglucosamine sulfohydrolase